MSVVVKLLPCVKIGMTRWYRKGKHVVRDFTSNWIGKDLWIAAETRIKWRKSGDKQLEMLNIEWSFS